MTQNTLSTRGKIGAESFGFAVAETVSMSTSLGVVGIADQVAPGLLKGASKVVSKVCIEPFLDTIEGTLSTVCRLKECQPDMTKTREERAESLAKTLIVFSSAWATSMAAKVLTRRLMNDWAGIKENKPLPGQILSTNEKKIFLADEGIHYGMIAIMNTIGAPVTDEMINSTANILNKCGVPEKKAHEVASMAVVWELPNLMGMVAGIGAIAHNHMKESHAAKLLSSRESTALSSSLSAKP